MPIGLNNDADKQTPFYGTFYGNNHVIRNLYVKTNCEGGLFSRLRGGKDCYARGTFRQTLGTDTYPELDQTRAAVSYSLNIIFSNYEQNIYLPRIQH